MKQMVCSILACVALAASAVAGTYTVQSGKQYKDPYVAPLCFADTELTIDLFGTYQAADKGRYFSDGFGGGVGLNYFFARYFGIGVEGHWNDQSAGSTVIHSVNGSLILRLPIDEICLAPYIFGGGGGSFDSRSLGLGHIGGGLEWRATHNIGIFGDGRYTWTEKVNDYGLFRLGVRFVF